MIHADDPTQGIAVSPPLTPPEVELLAGLAGVGSGPRRIWPGQPGRRSPWLPCADGCCLVVVPLPGADPAEWLRFLLRALLAPTSRSQMDRARRWGLPGDHRVSGVVVFDEPQPWLLVASGRRVRSDTLGARPTAADPARRREERGGGEADGPA